MLSEKLRKMDDIFRYIIPERYVIGRSADIVPFFEQLTAIHHEFSDDLEKLMDRFLQLPHSKNYVDDVIIRKREEMEYIRQKATELSDNLDEDDLIPMAPEVVNFLNTLLHYLSTASGKITDYYRKRVDLLQLMEPSAFTLEQKIRTISLKYEFRTETGELINDDLGYKMYLMYNQEQRDWGVLVLAYEHLKFLRK